MHLLENLHWPERLQTLLVTEESGVMVIGFDWLKGDPEVHPDWFKSCHAPSARHQLNVSDK